MARPKNTETSVARASDDEATVVLRGVMVPLTSDVGGAFVSDASRNRERLLSDQRLTEKYGLTMSAWAGIAKNSAFRLAVEAEHERRIRNGDAAKEAAAKLFAEAPEVLGDILRDKQANARHRIEAARELRAAAGVGSETTPASDRYHIVINLGEDQKLEINKRIAPLTPEEAKENIDAD